MGYGYVGRRRPPAVTPGEWCPARRTNKAYDPAVKVVDMRQLVAEGRRECPRCGSVVTVTQSVEATVPLTAWYYERHRVPESHVSGREDER